MITSCPSMGPCLDLQKRLEELPEAELENMLAQVEEERTRLQQRRDKRSS